MILPADLQLASIITTYSLYAGQNSTLQTDALTFAHVVRRAIDDVTPKSILRDGSHLLDTVFLLALRPNAILSPNDFRLYMRIFVSSRLPPVAAMWNNMSAPSYDTVSDAYDVVSADNAVPNETYVYFTNDAGTAEAEYVSTPTDVFKMVMYRRTPDVHTFTNSKASKLNKIVYTTPGATYTSECNGYPIKMYKQSEIDDEARALLSGRYRIVV